MDSFLNETNCKAEFDDPVAEDMTASHVATLQCFVDAGKISEDLFDDLLPITEQYHPAYHANAGCDSIFRMFNLDDVATCVRNRRILLFGDSFGGNFEIIETVNYHMIGMHFTIKLCTRVP